MTKDDYYRVWGKIESSFFDYKKTIFGVKRREFCYAGDWAVIVHLGTGNMTQCYCSFYGQNILDNPDKPILFKPIGNRCKIEHCYNGHLYLTIGVIPDLITPKYGDIRDREEAKWITPDMKSFMNGKLANMNKEYSFVEKFSVNVENDMRFFGRKIANVLKRVKNKISFD
jgi:hypothetical protein